MQQSRATKKQNQIAWRQEKVLELAGNGYSEREIANQMQISDTTIHRDLILLREQAKEHIHKYIDERVPFEYQKTLAGLEGIIKNMSNIIFTSTDNEEIMKASSIKMQAYNLRMEMVSSANLV
ncbi:MAG: ECF-type sigma factor, partial [Nitrososphaeraceae archaeon]